MVMMAKTMVEAGLDGKSVSFKPIGVNNSVDFTSAMDKDQINVLYIGTGLTESEVQSVSDYATEKQILAIGSYSEHAEKGNTAVGIIVEDKVKLIINLPATKKFGVNFDPRLYRLADKVIK
jgi:ABC-type uncharacterized transport system substrate-binding protein